MIYVLEFLDDKTHMDLVSSDPITKGDTLSFDNSDAIYRVASRRLFVENCTDDDDLDPKVRCIKLSLIKIDGGQHDPVAAPSE